MKKIGLFWLCLGMAALGVVIFRVFLIAPGKEDSGFVAAPPPSARSETVAPAPAQPLGKAAQTGAGAPPSPPLSGLPAAPRAPQAGAASAADPEEDAAPPAQSALIGQTAAATSGAQVRSASPAQAREPAPGPGGSATGSPPVPPAAAAPPLPAPASLAELASRKADLSDPQKRAELVAQMKALEDAELAAAHEKAKRLGIPLEVDRPGGGKAYLVGFDGDLPIYEGPDNVNAAISTAANLVRATAPFNANGSGLVFGLWEAGGIPRLTHQEFGGRITVRDGSATVTDHATHVAGTLAGAGVNPALLGMAPAALIDAYNSTSDASEATAAGASYPGEPGKIYISNHSYGFIRGWNGNTWYGGFTDDGNANDIETRWGIYDSNSVTWDGMTYNLPYYLPFMSAGNERNDGPPATGAVWYQGPSGTERNYDPAQHPPGDGQYKGGYDLLESRKAAKNVMTVGAANDAVSAGARHAPNGTLTAFSSTGPADDGRIKPDIVANGASLLSAGSASDTATYTASGTSMSGPNAAGSAMLLVDYYRQRFPGQAMRASTLKALIIHTADDIGNPGPDYQYGWGLMNTEAAARVIEKHAGSGDNPLMIEDRLTTADNSHTRSFTWNGEDPIRVTLCWTDPPATSSTAHDNRTPRLVNNLNLTVTGPGGSTHLPFVMPYVGNWSEAMLSAPAITGVNNVDNVEQVYVAAPPQPGLYTVTVNHAGSLTHGEQRYSLIITGGITDVVQVSPLTGLAASGDAGGPFTPSQKTYTITNSGETPENWTASADQPWVELSAVSGTVAAGATADVIVSLNAAAAAGLPAGIHEAMLTITVAGAQYPRAVSLRAEGDVPQIAVQQPAGTPLSNGASTVDFGSLELGGEPLQREFVLSNLIPGAALELGAITVSGADAADFTVSTAGMEASLDGGESTAFTVQFSSKVTGPRTATLNIASNDPENDPFVVALTGEGIARPGPEQEIIAAEVSPRRVADGSLHLDAFATSGLPLTYEVLAGPVTVDEDGWVTPAGADGAVTIKISQSGGGGYDPAEDLYVTFVLGEWQPFTKIVASWNTYAIKADGTLWTWGYANGTGSLADATASGQGRVAPQQIGAVTNWTDLDVGNAFGLGLRANGTLWAWGNNNSGQLGDGTTTTRTAPVQIGFGRTWSAMAAGNSHGVAIATDGTLWTWGLNTNGQLGQGDTTQRSSPTQVGTANDWSRVSARGHFTIALKTNGELWAWGENLYGQLGLGDTTQRNSPVRVGSDNDWAQIAGGSIHALALKTDGTLWAWGTGNSGRLGNGGTTTSLVPVQVGTASDWTAISGGNANSAARKQDGSVWIWGSNSSGQLGDGSTTYKSTPQRFAPGNDWAGIQAGVYHTAAWREDGMVWVAGEGRGFSGVSPRALTPAASTAPAWAQLSGSGPHFHVVYNNGRLGGWGRNNRGALGDGSTADKRAITQIGSENQWAQVASGSHSNSNSFTLAVKKNGTLWGAGINTNSQLGLGDTTQRNSFTQIGTASNWKQAASGANHGMAVRADGTLWGWGLNSSGQLGLGDTAQRTTPAQVGSAADWQAVACGGNHSAGLKANGTLWTWGLNTSGQLGLGDTAQRTAPAQVGSDADWTAVVCGLTHTLALKSDGTLWAWGLNSSGQLGLGNTLSRNVPTRVGTATHWTRIAASRHSSAALTVEGEIWTTGENRSGQLGDGATANVLTFTQVGTATGFQHLAIGSQSLAAIHADGTFWTAGAAGNQVLDGGRDMTVVAPVQPQLAPQSIDPFPENTLSGRVTASSGLPVRLSLASGPGEINGDEITHTGPPGSTAIFLAWQPGDERAWNAAPPAQIAITRHEPITFLTQPQSLVVSEVDEVVFSVEVAGSGPITYRWRKNGVELPEEIATGSELRLPSVTLEDEGEYDVVVTNPLGDFTSETAMLLVAGDVPRIVQEPQDQILYTGSDLVLEAIVAGRPPLSYQWKFNGKNIPGATERRLALYNAGTARAGRYSVVVASATAVESRQAEVAFVTNQPVPLVVAEQAKATLKVTSAGNGLTHTWTFNDGPLPAGGRHQVSADGKTLTIQKAEAGDSGVYACQVSNAAGSLPGGTTQLSVFDAPPQAEVQDMPDGIVGGWYEHQVKLAGGANAAATSYKAKGLPPGVKINAKTGLISGVPTRSNTYAITITASNKKASVEMPDEIFIHPFPNDLEGGYTALADRQPALNGNLGGRLDFSVTKLGAVSGKLAMGDQTYRLKSALMLDPTGADKPRLRVVIPRSGTPPPQPMTLELEIDLTAQTLAASKIHAGEDEAVLQGWRQTWHKRQRPANAYTGYHTYALELDADDLDDPAIPQGNSHGSFTVGTDGKLRVSGRMSDATALTHSGFLGPQGQIGLFATLYGKPVPGSVTGVLTLGLGDLPANPADNPLSGLLTWSRPDRRPKGGQTYAAGFGPIELTALGGCFNPPPLLLNVPAGGGEAELRFAGAGVEGSSIIPDVTVSITANNRAIPSVIQNPAGVKLKTTPAKGLFSGSFTLKDPHWEKPAPAVWPRKSSYQGIILRNGEAFTGHGYFLLPQLPAANPKTNPPDILSGQVLFQRQTAPSG